MRRMRPTLARWWRLLLGLLAVVLVAAWVGLGPFLAGIRAVDGKALAAAIALTVFTTLCCTWRWRLVLGHTGTHVGWWQAVGEYYRSQFLDASLPGGVVGDVVRGVRSGRRAADLAHGMRAALWERTLGQLVQWIVTMAVLLWLPSPLRRFVPLLIVLAVVAVVVLWLARRWLAARWPRRFHHLTDMAGREILAMPWASWCGVLVTSIGALGGYVSVFLVAMAATGTGAVWQEGVPLALLILIGAAIPVNVAGFGPREGVAAWAFAAAGLTPEAGVSAATAYGILAVLASFPGAVLLLVDWLRSLRVAH